MALPNLAQRRADLLALADAVAPLPTGRNWRHTLDARSVERLLLAEFPFNLRSLQSGLAATAQRMSDGRAPGDALERSLSDLHSPPDAAAALWPDVAWPPGSEPSVAARHAPAGQRPTAPQRARVAERLPGDPRTQPYFGAWPTPPRDGVRPPEAVPLPGRGRAGEHLATLPQWPDPAAAPGGIPVLVPPPATRWRPDADLLRGLLQEHHGSIEQIAQALGRDRRQVYRWLQYAGIGEAEVRTARGPLRGLRAAGGTPGDGTV
ncbi:MAG: helix-turn-helix domain-containing protein [Deltaproteobacteria bacterium]|nr:helix-turn-helix domain-containing protein [Deltaproteobacteria bacterium]